MHPRRLNETGSSPRALGRLTSLLALWLLCLGASAAWALPNQLAPAASQPTSSLPTPSQPTPSQPGTDTAATDFRIVAFGSSSTQGIGATAPNATYPAQLERLLRTALHSQSAISVVNRGIGGEDVDDMLKRLKSDILARKPSLVLWQVGSNDPLRGVPVDRFKTKLKAGLSAFASAGIEVILIEPQWSPAIAAVDGSSVFVDAVRDVGAEEHVLVVRRYELMHKWVAEGRVSAEALIGPDKLHMTDVGYAMLAKAVFDQMSAQSAALQKFMAPSLVAKHL